MRISDWSSDVCSSDLPSDTINTAYNRMRANDVSQLPVMDGDRIVGLLDEEDLLMAVHECPDCFGDAVDRHMTSHLDTLPATAETAALLPLFKADRSEEHTSELQSLMRISYAVFCLKKKKTKHL